MCGHPEKHHSPCIKLHGCVLITRPAEHWEMSEQAQPGFTIFLPLWILELTINMINKTHSHWNPQHARHYDCLDVFSHLTQSKRSVALLFALEQRTLKSSEHSSSAKVETGARRHAGWSVPLRSGLLPCLLSLWVTQPLRQYSFTDLECKVECDPRGLAITGKDNLHKIFS